MTLTEKLWVNFCIGCTASLIAWSKSAWTCGIFSDKLSPRQFSPLRIRRYLRITGMEMFEAVFSTNTVYFPLVPTENKNSTKKKNTFVCTYRLKLHK